MNIFTPIARLRRYMSRRRWQDFVVVSYPKSGRTWLRVMLDELGIAIAHTHAGARRQPAIDGAKFAGLNVILLIRDPRDTVVSAYHQATKRVDQKFDGSLSDFIRDPSMGIERIINFHLAWLASRRVPKQFLLLEYEALRVAPRSEMDRVLSFLGNNRCTPMEIDRAIELADFDRMQKLEQEGAFTERYGESLTPRDRSDPNSFKVRKGKVGGYLEELSEDDVTYCNAVLKGHGYNEKVAAARA